MSIVDGVYRIARPRATPTAATAISLPHDITLAAPLNAVTEAEGEPPVNVPLAVGRIVTEAEARELVVKVIFVVDGTGVTDGGVTDGGVTETGVTDFGVTEIGVTDTGVTDTGVTDGTGVDSWIDEVWIWICPSEIWFPA